MKAGRLSYSLGDSGERLLDTSELTRLFPLKSDDDGVVEGLPMRCIWRLQAAGMALERVGGVGRHKTPPSLGARLRAPKGFVEEEPRDFTDVPNFCFALFGRSDKKESYKS